MRKLISLIVPFNCGYHNWIVDNSYNPKDNHTKVKIDTTIRKTYHKEEKYVCSNEGCKQTKKEWVDADKETVMNLL